MAFRRGVIELSRTQQRAVVLVLAAVIPAVLVMLGVVIFRRVDDGGSGPRTVDAGAPESVTSGAATTQTRADADALVRWATASLPHDAVVAAGPTELSSLRRAGFGSVVSDEAKSSGAGLRSTPNVEYVLATASSPGRLVARSEPLARQGTATLREVVAGTSEVRARIRDDGELRRTGGRELLANDAVRPDTASRQVLRRGGLDLRVQNVVSALAVADTVRLTCPTLDVRERRAGRPVRAITLGTRDAGATASRLLAMPAPYRPRSVDIVSRHSVRAVWLPALAPDQPVGN